MSSSTSATFLGQDVLHPWRRLRFAEMSILLTILMFFQGTRYCWCAAGWLWCRMGQPTGAGNIWTSKFGALCWYHFDFFSLSWWAGTKGTFTRKCVVLPWPSTFSRESLATSSRRRKSVSSSCPLLMPLSFYSLHPSIYFHWPFSSAHYLAYCKKEDGWFASFNDGSTERKSFGEVQNEAATTCFFLFYEFDSGN